MDYVHMQTTIFGHCITSYLFVLPLNKNSVCVFIYFYLSFFLSFFLLSVPFCCVLSSCLWAAPHSFCAVCSWKLWFGRHNACSRIWGWADCGCKKITWSCYFKGELLWWWENVSVTYVTLVPWRRERRRHVGWPTKLGSRQRDQSTSSVTKRANGHWHAIIASSCRWSPCEYKRQQVHRINSCFRWGAEPETRQLSGGTATVATGRDVSVPSFRERGLHT